MASPVHTPYDGSAEPFTIGLKSLDPAAWLEIDGDLPRYLAEKERLFAADPAAVFAETPGSRVAQAEARDLVLRYLGDDFPSGISEPDAPPLWQAARMIQEDLVIMERDGDGWRLTAASLSFPSSWSLAEKFGRVMDDIHAPVPGFQRGTRNAALIARMFDNLKPDRPVWRLNWSVYGDDALHHPASKADGRPMPAFLADNSFIRVERQTLRRLPATGALLFTIRIYVDPLSVLRGHADGAALRDGLERQLLSLDADQLAYKGLAERRDALIAAIRDSDDRHASLGKP
jgi:dimethylamine monooxygenase subunit A